MLAYLAANCMFKCVDQKQSIYQLYLFHVKHQMRVILLIKERKRFISLKGRGVTRELFQLVRGPLNFFTAVPC